MTGAAARGSCAWYRAEICRLGRNVGYAPDFFRSTPSSRHSGWRCRWSEGDPKEKSSALEEAEHRMGNTGCTLNRGCGNILTMDRVFSALCMVAQLDVKTMPILEWLESFELRVPEIDGDHRTMLDLMKAVQLAAAARDRKRGERYLNRLLAYSQSHFAREEILLERWKYPDAEEHAAYHAGLQARAEAVRQACAKIETPEAFEECCEEMMSFLVDDVVRGDIKLKSFMEKAGLTLPV